MKKVYTVMVGDLFHYGHVELLRRARSLGEYLVVGVVTDSEATAYKRRPVMALMERRAVIKSCRYVDEVMDQSGPTTTKFMRDHGFDVFAYAAADDAENEYKELNFYADLDGGFRVRLPYTVGISTQQIIKRVLVAGVGHSLSK